MSEVPNTSPDQRNPHYECPSCGHRFEVAAAKPPCPKCGTRCYKGINNYTPASPLNERYQQIMSEWGVGRLAPRSGRG